MAGQGNRVAVLRPRDSPAVKNVIFLQFGRCRLRVRSQYTGPLHITGKQQGVVMLSGQIYRIDFQNYFLKILAFAGILTALLLSRTGWAAMADAQGTVYGSYNGDNHTVYSNDVDIAVAPVPSASISNTFIDNGFTFQYSASAAVDTGQLKVKNLAMSDATASGGYSAASGSGVPSVFARIEETLTFTPSGTNPYDVSFSMLLDGLYQLAPSSTGYALAYLSVDAGGGNFGYQEVEFSPGNFTIIEFLNFDLTLQGQTSVYLTAVLSSQMLSIAGPDQYSAFSFDNTAQLAVSAPGSVTMESESGLFLTQAPVPVPAAAWLFASALLALAGVTRR